MFQYYIVVRFGWRELKKSYGHAVGGEWDGIINVKLQPQ